VEIKKRNQIGLALNGATENNKEDPSLMGSKGGSRPHREKRKEASEPPTVWKTIFYLSKSKV